MSKIALRETGHIWPPSPRKYAIATVRLALNRTRIGHTLDKCFRSGPGRGETGASRRDEAGAGALGVCASTPAAYYSSYSRSPGCPRSGIPLPHNGVFPYTISCYFATPRSREDAIFAVQKWQGARKPAIFSQRPTAYFVSRHQHVHSLRSESVERRASARRWSSASRGAARGAPGGPSLGCLHELLALSGTRPVPESWPSE
jgi:hypothetical protein